MAAHEDKHIQSPATKLQLKPSYHEAFYATTHTYLQEALAHYPKDHRSISASKASIIADATDAFLKHHGFNIWPCNTSYRQHLTVLSVHGDKDRKQRTKIMRRYHKERDEYEKGKMSDKPKPPPKVVKGLVWIAAGREEIERLVGKYFERMFVVERCWKA